MCLAAPAPPYTLMNMAHVIGECGSVKQLSRMLLDVGIWANTPDMAKQEIQAFLSQLEASIKGEQEAVMLRFRAEAEERRGATDELLTRQDELQRQKVQAVSAVRAFIEAPEKGGWRGVIRGTAALVRSAYRVMRVRADLKRVARRRAALETEVAAAPAQMEVEIASVERTNRSKVEALRRIEASYEMAGACGEWEVLCALQSLPDEYVVINDVQLTAHTWYYFEGDHLKTAQLDHVVVGPTGVYVVETKRWSAATANDADVMSPYKQVRRAGFLLYKELEAAGARCRVREMICSRGTLPSRPHDFKGYVTTPAKIASLIRTREGCVLEAEARENIAAVIRRRVGR